MTVEIGHDGGFVIGRVGSDEATTVGVILPGRDQPITTRVRENGFFLLELSRATMRVVVGEDGGLWAERLASLATTATDAQGQTVGTSDPYDFLEDYGWTE